MATGMRKPSASMVVATVALVMATTGTGIAASNYVITSSSQVKSGSLSASDLSRSARRTLRGRAGATGARGATGATGATGAAGKDGAPGRDGAAGRGGAAGRDGATGPIGPSDAWQIDSLGTANGVDVPPGSYVVTGQVYMGSVTLRAPQCIVYHGLGRISFGYAAGDGSSLSLPVSEGFTTTATQHIYLGCSGYNTYVSTSATVYVIRVGTLHQ